MFKEYAISDYVKGKDIKRVRKSLNLTQKEFALVVGCSKPTIERWESSDNKITGPIVLLLQMLENDKNYIKSIKINKNAYSMRIYYMYENKLCTIIDVNEIERKVEIHNYTNNILFKAFGAIENPTYEEYVDFLKSRCFPETRDKMKLILEDLNIPFYDPLLIIKKTEGRMEEDNFWLKIEEE